MVKMTMDFNYNNALLIIKNDDTTVFRKCINPGLTLLDIEKGIYKFILVTYDYVYLIPVYIKDKDISIVINLKYDYNTKYIRLFDYNYNVLKIMKGEITLWQENIK